MFRNVYYDKFTNTMHIWETIKGIRLYSTESWTPYIYVPTIRETNTKTIFGENVIKKTFNNMFSYEKFCNENTKIFENNVKPEIQYLCEKYASIPDDELEVPTLRIHTTDIEVHSTSGFPKPEEAVWPITIISCHDTTFNKLYTFGIREYNGENLKEPWYKYIKCNDEKDLLIKYISFIHKTQPDVITGWNCYRFDLHYIVNRIYKLFGNDEGKELISLLSPIKKVSSWYSRTTNEFNIDIAGVTILDYLPLYKKYTKSLLSINLESYKLDFVSKFELEKGKLDYSEYNDLKTLYEQNFNLYVDYNIVDVKRVKQIQEKRKFIQLVQTLSLLTKCPAKYYEAITSLIEGLFLTYYRRNNLCAPYFSGGVKEPYEAAYVKTPIPGFYILIADVDIASSYPHAMITLNMGNESYVGTIKNFITDSSFSGATEDLIIYYTKNRKFPPFDYVCNKKAIVINGDDLVKFNEDLKNGLYSIAPNGTIFRNDIKGSIAAVEQYVFDKRKETKKKMQLVYKEAELAEDNKQDSTELREKAERLKALQIGYKLLINSIYGALAVPYYRGFNSDIAEAICAVGRHAVKAGEVYVNEIMNNPELDDVLVNIINEIKNSNI